MSGALRQVDKLKKEKCKPKEQLTLEPYHRDHALVAGVYKIDFDNL